MDGAEIVITAINAMIHIDGDLSECRYEDIRIIFEENFLAKKQLPKKLTAVYKFPNAENCEHIFLIKDDINTLEEYEKNCKVGGCSHISEPVCGVKEALNEGKISRVRYENYVMLYEELKGMKKY